MRKHKPDKRTRAFCEITIVNELGLHARPAAEFVRRAHVFRSDIWIVTKSKERFSALSLIEVMRANLNQGAVATLEAVGPDAAEAVADLAKLLPKLE